MERVRDYVPEDNNSIFESLRRQLKSQFSPTIGFLRQTAATEGVIAADRYRNPVNRAKYNDKSWCDEVMKLSKDMHWNMDLHREFIQMIFDSLVYTTEQRQMIIVTDMHSPAVYGPRNHPIDSSTIIIVKQHGTANFSSTKLGNVTNPTKISSECG